MMKKIRKFFSSNYNGEYKGIIEEIGTGKKSDLLMMSNRRRNLWVFSLFNGYRQIGNFKAIKPHNYKPGDLVIVTIEKGKVAGVTKDQVTISNIHEIYA